MRKLLQKIKKFLFGELYVITYYNSEKFIIKQIFMRAKNENEAFNKALIILKTIPFAIDFKLDKIEDEE